MTYTTPTGLPCWYELSASNLKDAGDFYAQVFGWEIADANMPGFTYHLATASSGGMVAGMMELPGAPEGSHPFWNIYFAVADVDATALAVSAAGGKIMVPPSDIPGTGRFSILTDPQGAVFGLLQPLAMEEAPANPAYDLGVTGHGGWSELSTTDPETAFTFYSNIFGWTKGTSMDMGDMGTYQVFDLSDTGIGGMQALMPDDSPAWLPYFGSSDVDTSADKITSAGGSILHGPTEVPDDMHIVVAHDPQGARFAVLGPRPTRN